MSSSKFINATRTQMRNNIPVKEFMPTRITSATTIQSSARISSTSPRSPKKPRSYHPKNDLHLTVKIPEQQEQYKTKAKVVSVSNDVNKKQIEQQSVQQQEHSSGFKFKGLLSSLLQKLHL
jgi:hypothetical protein